MSEPRSVAIAGGGIAGLGAAIAMRMAGWTVKVYERSPAIREVGAGIFLTHNALTVLHEYGIRIPLEERGTLLRRHVMRDGSDRLLQERDLTVDRAEILMVKRQDLIDALHIRAKQVGALVSTRAAVVGASDEGRLVVSQGDKFFEDSNDLVLGADGLRSRVRESLGLTVYARELPTVSVRYLLPAKLFGSELKTRFPQDASVQYWSGRRRLAVTPTGSSMYVYLSAPSGDPAEFQLTGWTRPWKKAIPAATELLELLTNSAPYIAKYSMVRTRSWIRQSAGLIGDAAHGLPPTLGQGACLALVNARGLARLLENSSSPIPTTLKNWEASTRPLTEYTQKWSGRYDRLTTRLPHPLMPLRSSLIRFVGARSALDQRLRAASRLTPEEIVLDGSRK